MRPVYELIMRWRISVSVINVDMIWDGSTNFGMMILFSIAGTLGRSGSVSTNAAPTEIYSHALEKNKNIIHITFRPDSDDFCDLPPWVTSISYCSGRSLLPEPLHEPLFIKPIYDALIKFAKGIRPKLDPLSTYIFTDANWIDLHPGKLMNDTRV
jgi:hypothetical protein